MFIFGFPSKNKINIAFILLKEFFGIVIISDYVFVHGMLLFFGYKYFHFIVCAVLQISNVLGIKVFQINKKKIKWFIIKIISIQDWNIISWLFSLKIFLFWQFGKYIAFKLFSFLLNLILFKLFPDLVSTFPSFWLELKPTIFYPMFMIEGLPNNLVFLVSSWVFILFVKTFSLEI